jgi:hypothetical protein
MTGITVGVRVFQDVEQVATLDVKDDILEPDAALLPDQAAVLMLNRDLEGERGGTCPLASLISPWRLQQFRSSSS